MIILKRKIIGIVAAICILVITAVIFINNIKPSSTAEDIEVEGILQLNKTGEINYKDYILNINMIKKKDCQVIVYPYFIGIGTITFNEKEKDGYYLPGSIGSDGVTEPVAINELKNKCIIDRADDFSLTGFWFPNTAGQYKARLYLDRLDNVSEIRDPYLVCVGIENKYGKQFTWTKLVPITIE